MTGPAPRLYFYALSMRKAPELLAAFAQALGPDTMCRAYGPGWPTKWWMNSAQVWSITAADSPNTGAWGAVTPDPEDLAVWLTLGIFPPFQRKGWRNVIREFLHWEAARLYPDAQTTKIGIRWDNSEYLRTAHYEARQGSAWRPVGDITHPFNYFLFARKIIQPNGEFT